MNRKCWLAAAVVVVTCLPLASPAPGAGWPEIKGLQFTQRAEVEVANPADVAVDAALVHLSFADLAKVLPDAKPGQVAVIDPETKPAPREQADQNFVPFQESDGDVIFSLPLKAHQTKQVYVYTSPHPLNLPGFPAGTAYDSRHAYRSFENRYMAFRFESGPGSNTTGMSLDLFGKSAKGVGLRLVELYQAGHDSYHELQYWGQDVLKVGDTPGAGGIFLVSGKEVGRAAFQTILAHCDYQGPVETRFRLESPVEVGGKTYGLTRILTLVADDRSIRDEVQVTGDGADALEVAVGIRDLPKNTWTEHPDQGYAFVTGDRNQPGGYKAVGMGCLFDPKAFVRIEEWHGKTSADVAHLYVLKGHAEGGRLVSKDRLASVWDQDCQLPKPVDTADELKAPFEEWFHTWAAQRDNPITIKLGEKAESAS